MANDNGYAKQPLTDEVIINKDYEQVLDDLFEIFTTEDMDLDEIVSRSTHTVQSKGVDDAHLSKVWMINLKASERKISIILQN